VVDRWPTLWSLVAGVKGSRLSLTLDEAESRTLGPLVVWERLDQHIRRVVLVSQEALVSLQLVELPKELLRRRSRLRAA
jgi:hypothetical protein